MLRSLRTNLANWLMPTQTKASKVTGVIVDNVRPKDAVPTPRDYATLAKEGYQEAVWVYACARAIVTAAKEAPVVARQQMLSGEVRDIANSRTLRLLRRPNSEMTWASFLDHVLHFWLLSGNTYIERVATSERAPVLELWPKRPDRMRIKPGNADGKVAGFTYKIGQQKPIMFEPWEILHVKSFHPLNDFYGMSVIEAAAKGIDMFNLGAASNIALLQNGARPGGAWKVDGGDARLTDEEFARLQEEILQFEGALNSGRQVILEGGLEYMPLAATPRDLDFIAGLDNAGRQIHSAFGVHPVVTGLQEGTFENQKQAKRALYTDVVLPVVGHILEALSLWLAPAMGEAGITLEVDRDSIPALSDDQDSLYKRANTVWVSGVITQNEARELIGFEPVSDGDVFFNEDTLAIALEAEGEGVDVDEAEVQPSEAGGVERTDSTAPVEERAFNIETPQQRIQHWRGFTRRQDRAMAVFGSQVRKVFRQERKRIRDKLEGLTDATEINTAVVDAVIDRGIWQETLTAASLAVAEEFGRATLRSLPKRGELPEESKALSDVFGVLLNETVDFVRSRAARQVTRITNSTKEQLRRALRTGAEEGEDIRKIAKRIDRLFIDQIIPNRSKVIARTEVIRASNFGSQQAAAATGLNIEREWITTLDGRARDAHMDADGQRQPMGTPFQVDGESLKFPGDPDGSADNTIQCRCVEGFHVIEP